MFGLVLIFVIPAVLANPLAPRIECPKFTPVEDFDIPQYLGRWYDIEHSKWNFGGEELLCTSPKYGLINATTVSVENFSLLDSALGLFPVKATGTASVTDIPGSLLVDFPYGDSPSPLTPDGYGNYNVLKTDYVTYSCIYDCQPTEDQVYDGVIAWVVSRTPQLADAARQECEDVFFSLGVDMSNFIHTYQGPDCTYPED
ncbi:unnamed protein product [Meganyctiphanes norvegica]|uniref:Lipocalin/cytosolic fatty-acid binding domain-containing protein n=1 Tax=Meganyctiphanes norvegica TaxID=48144 RepID=A0AAV2RYM5_MEGNR